MTRDHFLSDIPEGLRSTVREIRRHDERGEKTNGSPGNHSSTSIANTGSRLNHPVFGASEVDEYARLVDWTDRLSTAVEEPVVEVAPVGALLQTIDGPNRAVNRANFQTDVALDKGDTEPARKPRRVQRGAPKVESPEANPYDPATFNGAQRASSPSPEGN